MTTPPQVLLRPWKIPHMVREHHLSPSSCASAISALSVLWELAEKVLHRPEGSPLEPPELCDCLSLGSLKTEPEARIWVPKVDLGGDPKK